MAEEKQNGAGVSKDQALKLLDTTTVKLRQAEKWGYIPKPEKGGYPLAQLVRGYSRYQASGEVTIEDAGIVIGKSGDWVRKLVNDGYIQRNERGNVTKEGSFAGYVRWMNDEDRRSSKTAAESQLKQARQREIELRIAERERAVIDVSELFSVVEELTGLFSTSLDGLPARITRDLPLRRKIETDIDEIRRQIVARAEQRSAELRAGRNLAEADPEDDAG